MKVTVKVSLKKPTPDRHNMLVTEILKKHKDLKKKKKKIQQNIFLLTPLLLMADVFSLLSGDGCDL